MNNFRMKILVLNYEFPPLGGGASPVSYEIAKNLVAKGHDVDVITMGFKGLKSFELVDRINVYRVPAIRRHKGHAGSFEMLTYLISAFPFTLKKVRKEQYDVIHCHFIIPTGALAFIISKLTKTPYILTMHGSDVPGFNVDRFTFEHKFTQPFLKAILGGAAKIISPSEYLKGLALKNIGKFDIKVIPNGVNLDRFGKFLNMPKKNMIFVATRLVPRKGVQYVLKALENIKVANINDWEFHIAGDGPYLVELKRLARNSKMKVVFHGWLNDDSDEYRRLYSEAKIYVLPSKSENSSISLLEAMLCRSAIITTNVTGCPETVEDTAILVDPESPNEIGKALEKLISNPKLIDKYSEIAYKRLLKFFTWDKIINQYEKELAEATKK